MSDATRSLLRFFPSRRWNTSTIRRSSAAEYAHVLKDPKRDDWQKPHHVIMALAFRKEEVIADIGAGNGYFTEKFARHGAKVYAVDIEPKLLEMIKGDRVERVTALPDDPRNCLRLVSILSFSATSSTTLTSADLTGQRWPRHLKPGGRVVIMDFHRAPATRGSWTGDEDRQGSDDRRTEGCRIQAFERLRRHAVSVFPRVQAMMTRRESLGRRGIVGFRGRMHRKRSWIRTSISTIRRGPGGVPWPSPKETVLYRRCDA
jgi:SAM-dependent methyltransferase